MPRQVGDPAPLDEWIAAQDDADRRSRRKIPMQDGSGGRRVMPARYADDGEVEHDA